MSGEQDTNIADVANTVSREAPAPATPVSDGQVVDNSGKAVTLNEE